MSGWTFIDTWILVIGVLAAVSCALLGSFMVLRRMSMMGDAISHAVLPGLAGAFLLTVLVQDRLAETDALPAWLDSIAMINARSGPVMFAGAAIIGVLTALFTQLIHQYGKVEQSAAMGVVFTTLFALGLILMVRAADAVDLDPGCVLYGAIELAPLDTVHVLGADVPRTAVVLGAVAVLDALFVIVFFKELKITSFDPTLATTIGIRASVMHYLLMTMIALTTVAAFEAVGSILVVAMLIVPAATAHLLTDRLPTMLVVAALVGALGAGLGTAVTVPGWFGHVDTNTAGAMATAGGVLFALTVLAAPRHGILGRILRRRAVRTGIVREDVLGLLYRLEEHGLREPAPRVFRRVMEALDLGPAAARRALRTLARQRLVVATSQGYRMTVTGRDHARTLVRSHRLWESYLVKHLALPVDHVHDTAMKLEHITVAEMRADLAAEADHPERDPHGRIIPPALEGTNDAAEGSS